MLSFLMGLLGIAPAAFQTINQIEAAISNEKLAQISAKTDQDRIASQERVATLQARRDVLMAEATTTAGIWNARMRILVAIGPTLVLLKLSFDKAIGPFFGCVGKTAPNTCAIFTTDPLDPHQWYALGAVICFYLAAEAYRGASK